MKKIKIRNYQCVACGLEIRVQEMHSYICPHCGELLVPQDEKYKRELELRIKEVNEEKINDTIKHEKKIFEMIKNPVFDKLDGQIKSMFQMLKDPAVGFGIKAAITAAFIYLVSPIDIIPDIIPVLGYLDDISIILLTLNLIRENATNIYFNYNLKGKIDYQTSPIIYSIYGEKGVRECNYFEEKGRRIWQLSADEMMDKGYRLLNNALVKAPENYIRHPYTAKLLVPTSTYDRQLSDTLVEEITTLARIFGAKDIELEVNEFSYVKKDGDFALKAIDLKMEFGGNAEDKAHSKTYYKKQFDTFNEINLNDVSSLIWIFTNEHIASMRLAQERLFNGVKHIEYQTVFDSENIMQMDSKNDILKKNGLGVKIKFCKSIKKNIRVKINFHDIPEHILAKKEEIYKNFMERLEQQKLELI